MPRIILKKKQAGMAALYCAKTNIPKFANPIMSELAKGLAAYSL